LDTTLADSTDGRQTAILVATEGLQTVTHRYLLVAVMIAWAGAGGCATCSNSEDYRYGAYGSCCPRSDPCHGRVGSVFSDGMLLGESPEAAPVIETPQLELTPESEGPSVFE
jgi:hypothetical protein